MATNTTRKTTITGGKTWNDNGDQDGKRETRKHNKWEPYLQMEQEINKTKQ